MGDAMGYIEVILTVCALSNPVNCEDRRLRLNWDGTPRQCAMAQPYIAAWIGDHPEWTVKKWTCDYPDKRKQDI
jgi:hypothetical protein